jgi:hypothetical protein
MEETNPYLPPRDIDPDSPPAVPPPPHKKWPKVFGIISCVLAASGIVFSPLMVVFNRWNPATRDFRTILPDWYGTLEMASTVVGMALSAVLLAGGVMLVKRRPGAAALHVGYAAVDLVTTVAATTAMYVVMNGVDTVDLSFANQAALTGGKIGGLIGGLFGVVYPIFLLAWFSRRPIRDEVRTFR